MAEFRFMFRAKEYEKAVAFYRDGLGLSIAQSWDRGPEQRGTVFTAASGLVEVLALMTAQTYVPPQGFEIGIEVENVDNWYEKVRRNGLAVRGELSNKPWGHRTFSLQDPDGIKVIIYTILP